MVQFMFSGKETIVTSIQDLDLLFEIFRLADKVLGFFRRNPIFSLLIS